MRGDIELMGGPPSSPQSPPPTRENPVKSPLMAWFSENRSTGKYQKSASRVRSELLKDFGNLNFYLLQVTRLLLGITESAIQRFFDVKFTQYVSISFIFSDSRTMRKNCLSMLSTKLQKTTSNQSALCSSCNQDFQLRTIHAMRLDVHNSFQIH